MQRAIEGAKECKKQNDEIYRKMCSVSIKMKHEMNGEC